MTYFLRAPYRAGDPLLIFVSLPQRSFLSASSAWAFSSMMLIKCSLVSVTPSDCAVSCASSSPPCASSDTWGAPSETASLGARLLSPAISAASSMTYVPKAIFPYLARQLFVPRNLPPPMALALLLSSTRFCSMSSLLHAKAPVEPP
ncbi:unnamed protein product [Linum trigynum]|uniref:Uncharacterized protein n=1 Tax=Linum trigynum TaxID=586398 RepID=A0AAV2D7D7_9ROSI